MKIEMQRADKPAKDSRMVYVWAMGWLRDNAPGSEVTVGAIKEIARCCPYGYPKAFQKRWLYSDGDPVNREKTVWKIRDAVPEEKKAEIHAHCAMVLEKMRER